jgi:hypothetical protein
MGKYGWLAYASKDRARRQVIYSIIAVIVYLFGTSGIIYVIGKKISLQSNIFQSKVRMGLSQILV